MITGVLDSIQREDAEDFVKRHGGQVKTGVSKKTSYLVTGREPGESKLKKVQWAGFRTRLVFPAFLCEQCLTCNHGSVLGTPRTFQSCV